MTEQSQHRKIIQEFLTKVMATGEIGRIMVFFEGPTNIKTKRLGMSARNGNDLFLKNIIDTINKMIEGGEEYMRNLPEKEGDYYMNH